MASIQSLIMQDQEPDPSELVIRRLLDSNVRFLVIGGWAVSFHGYKRQIKDLDLLVEFSPENWPKLDLALRPFHVSAIRSFEELSHRPDPKPIRILDLYPHADFVTEIKGVCFCDAWSEGIETTFAEGLRVRVISKAHLIRNKRVMGRSNDDAT